jgi:hypothetical protein
VAKIGQYPFLGFERSPLSVALTLIYPNGANAAIAVDILLESGVQGQTLDAQPAAFTISGQDATLLDKKVVDAQPAAFVVSGQDATFTRGRIISSDAGVFAITGQDATLLDKKVVDAQPGSFIITGGDATLLNGHVVDAQPGSFSITGDDATLQFIPSQGNGAFFQLFNWA